MVPSVWDLSPVQVSLGLALGGLNLLPLAPTQAHRYHRKHLAYSDSSSALLQVRREENRFVHEKPRFSKMRPTERSL